MIEINIPGRKTLQLNHLVCDVNGTLALDGELIEGVARVLSNLSDRLQIHLLTANTYGRQDEIDHRLNLKAFILSPGDEAEQKADYVRQLGAEHTIAIGQGVNDAAMLQISALGICVLSREGTALEALLVADLLVGDILNALELLEKPRRIVASLRR